MTKNSNDKKSLINRAIDASTNFEALMDSIDFNSYLLEEEEKPNVKETGRYQTYKSMVKRASDSCEDIIQKIPNKIKDSAVPPNSKDEEDLGQYLIYQLFEAKKTRLKGRQQIKREEEKRKYIESTHRLHKAFDSIPEKKFYYPQKGNSLTENYNWAKVLFYNEMAICYSGLAESSMSLGYAERSTSLLREIYPKIDSLEGMSSQDVKLYTFALYNKGEAERLLGNEDLSLKTFKKIVDIYEGENLKEQKSSDYYSALHRMALILIDQGRGEEAVSYLNRGGSLDSSDYRIQERDIEKASALIDKKEYTGAKGACAVLKPYLKEEEWKYTFTRRKAIVYELRLLIEFKRNRPEEFKEIGEQEQEVKNIRDKYNKDFELMAKELLRSCVETYDGDNFKKTCTYLADYLHEKGDRKRELRCYYLYLCNKAIFEQRDKLMEKEPDEIINDWISRTENELKALIEQYQDKNLVEFTGVLSEVDDEHYLRDFFEAYLEIVQEQATPSDEKEKEVIENLKERLTAVYHEKDNLIGLGEVEEKFCLYEEKIAPLRKYKAADSVKFVQECFFKGKPYSEHDRQITYLRPDSILTKMKQNINDFANKIVGETELFSPEENFRGVLTVLRRWNSFTPALASAINPSKGGGYFLYFWHKKGPLGVVIDPGYDFLDNLFSQGFRIGDINTVIVSHAHPDHTDNLPSILSLFHELNGRLGEYYHGNKVNKKHLKLILSQGVFDQYYKLIKHSEESLKDTLVVQVGSRRGNIPCYEYEFDDNLSLNIETFATSHRDLSQWESLGFIIEIKNNGVTRRIGYTSDAHWKPDFSERFKDCHIVCAHLGSIVDLLARKEFCNLCGNYNKDKSGKCISYDKCKATHFEKAEPTKENLVKQAQEQSHLYLAGLSMFFEDLLRNKKIELAVISEFGEELKGGIRMDLYHKFDDWFQARSGKAARCVPGDIGLEIDLLNCNIFCCCCQEYKSKDRISPIAYAKEEALFFVCDECKSTLSTYQIEAKLKDYYENGRKLGLVVESK